MNRVFPLSIKKNANGRSALKVGGILSILSMVKPGSTEKVDNFKIGKQNFANLIKKMKYLIDLIKVDLYITKCKLHVRNNNILAAILNLATRSDI